MTTRKPRTDPPTKPRTDEPAPICTCPRPSDALEGHIAGCPLREAADG